MKERNYIAVLSVLTCHKCGNRADDPKNPEISINESIEKYDSYTGWMCKCGYYNGLDP